MWYRNILISINLCLLGIRATGRTFKDDPITINKSQLFLSSSIALWKLSGRPSPKNTMSGFIIPKQKK